MRRRQMLLRLVAGCVAALAAFLQPAGLRAAPSVCDASVSSPARNFVLRDMDNRKWTFGSTKGKVVLVDFWATWCGPCKVEIPAFVEMYGRYKSQGFEVVGVSMDTDLAAIRTFAGEHAISYPILIGAGADGVTRAWGVSGLPTTVIIGRDGRVCRRFVGQAPREEFENTIRELLASSASSPTGS